MTVYVNFMSTRKTYHIFWILRLGYIHVAEEIYPVTTWACWYWGTPQPSPCDPSLATSEYRSATSSLLNPPRIHFSQIVRPARLRAPARTPSTQWSGELTAALVHPCFAQNEEWVPQLTHRKIALLRSPVLDYLGDIIIMYYPINWLYQTATTIADLIKKETNWGSLCKFNERE